MLVLRPGALGDTLLAVPALRALRRVFSPITLAGHPGAARLLCSLGEVDHGMAFDDPSLGRLFRGDACDEQLVAWMNPEAAPAVWHALLVAPGRPSTAQHSAEYLLETLAPLGIDASMDDRPLRVTPIPSNEVLIHPGSGSAAKNWPSARFAETIKSLDCPVRLIVGEADAHAALEVEADAGQPMPRLEHAPLEELAARLAGCRAYLGNDSGVSHLAGLCGTRTVVLYGPTSPSTWRPLGPQVHVEPFDVKVPQLISALSAD